MGRWPLLVAALAHNFCSLCCAQGWGARFSSYFGRGADKVAPAAVADGWSGTLFHRPSSSFTHSHSHAEVPAPLPLHNETTNDAAAGGSTSKPPTTPAGSHANEQPHHPSPSSPSHHHHVHLTPTNLPPFVLNGDPSEDPLGQCPFLRRYLENPFAYLDLMEYEPPPKSNTEFLAPRKKEGQPGERDGDGTHSPTGGHGVKKIPDRWNKTPEQRKKFGEQLREAIEALDRLDVDDRMRLLKRKSFFSRKTVTEADHEELAAKCQQSIEELDPFAIRSPDEELSEDVRGEAMKRWKLEILTLRQEKLNQRRHGGGWGGFRLNKQADGKARWAGKYSWDGLRFTNQKKKGRTFDMATKQWVTSDQQDNQDAQGEKPPADEIPTTSTSAQQQQQQQNPQWKRPEGFLAPRTSPPSADGSDVVATSRQLSQAGDEQRTTGEKRRFRKN
ncbi:unnamed protein product [Vitrella brassicaformis CCMP3155]|uniref:Uncharacterized protein n=1 Tax=Vitrella brassicaformis (strain CCMP3155) TaxID=1169540 RepID=A0A0G4FWI3_VITBC|nr:unnamed protein product [Vitrella brassicaformis CCMP3155]|eukprot:CEM19275.1 unnamed protein product [Vitrella brassicaformis CCMP3155]